MIVEGILSTKGSDVVCIGPTISVHMATATLSEKKIGALVVVDSAGQVIGVLSERDIIRGIASQGPDVLSKSVADLMTRMVHTVTGKDQVDHVMALMTERRIRHLPVVERGALKGIISIGDVVKHKIAETEQEAEALRSYISG